MTSSSGGNREIELKFGVDPARAEAVEAALSRMPSKSEAVESHYFDSADHRLAKAWVALRLRKTEAGWEQTVKAQGESALNRLEETVSLGRSPALAGDPTDGVPAVDLSLHPGRRVAKLIESAMGLRDVRDARFVALYLTRVERRSALLDTVDAQVEIAFDTGTIEAAGAALPICEVEYELKSGRPEILFDLGRAGIIEHGMWMSVLTKSMRGDLLSNGKPNIPAAKARRPALDRKMSGAMIFQAVIQACFEQVAINASAVAAGQCDDEVIHQLRVGLRRLRTAGRELASLNGGAPTTWETPVAQTFRVLGEYRDAATVASTLQSLLAEAGAPEPVLASREHQITHPVAAVRSASFQLALLQVLASAHGRSIGMFDSIDRETATLGPAESRKEIAARLDRLQTKLQRDAARFDELMPMDQHRVRKRLKRLRYLTELVGSLYDEGDVERYLKQLRPAQDALGHHVDLCVGLDMAREAAKTGDGKAWFNVGYLSAMLPRSTKACASALKKASRARAYWG